MPVAAASAITSVEMTGPRATMYSASHTVARSRLGDDRGSAAAAAWAADGNARRPPRWGSGRGRPRSHERQSRSTGQDEQTTFARAMASWSAASTSNASGCPAQAAPCRLGVCASASSSSATDTDQSSHRSPRCWGVSDADTHPLSSCGHGGSIMPSWPWRPTFSPTPTIAARSVKLPTPRSSSCDVAAGGCEPPREGGGQIATVRRPRMRGPQGCARPE